MREYIKQSKHAAIMLFRRGSASDFARADAIEAYNKAIAKRTYDTIMSGRADYAYIRDHRRLIVYTRSLRGAFIQASYFCEIDGTMEPTMHVACNDHNAVERTFIPGKYISCPVG